MRIGPVYVIDDDSAVTSSLEFYLSASGIACRCFMGPLEFLTALDELSPGCILMDVHMPKMSGIELHALLVKRSIDWPVILMSGECDTTAVQQALALGAVEFIAKPFAGDDLRLAMERAFARLPDLS